MSVINRVSVELEGGWVCNCNEIATLPWDVQKLAKLRPDLTPQQLSSIKWGDDYGRPIENCTCIPASIRHDGSVNSTLSQYKGEVSPDGGLPASEILDWVKANYPHRIDTSCGMHVHMSVKSPSIYLSMVTPEFETFLIDQLVRWGKAYKVPLNHPFWQRLVGLNTFAKVGITPELIQQQMIATHNGSERYFATNFCWAKHKTLEVRILPMFKQATTAMRAVNAVMRAVDRFAKQRTEHLKYRKTFTLSQQKLDEQSRPIEQVLRGGQTKVVTRVGWLFWGAFRGTRQSQQYDQISRYDQYDLEYYGVHPSDTWSPFECASS